MSSSATCVSCKEPLTIELEPDDEETAESTFAPDDVHLRCNCHYHWQCLLDSYSVTECPNCASQLASIDPSSGEQQLLCNYSNEGGYQANLDILPQLIEEAYLRTYPEERRGQALLEFCGEGDIEAIVDILKDDSEPANGHILFYQDHIKTERSGLHQAILGGHVDVAWMMLFLASGLDISHFPPEVVNAAASLDITRPELGTGQDIRALKDAQGRTAEQVAVSSDNPIWAEWVQAGRLRPRV